MEVRGVSLAFLAFHLAFPFSLSWKTGPRISGKKGLQKSAQINSLELVTYMSLAVYFWVATDTDLFPAWKDARTEKGEGAVLKC